MAHYTARSEQESGKRFCITCDKMLPLSEFAIGTRRYKCVTHFREMRRAIVLGTPERRAISSIRSRLRQDMILFGHTSIELSVHSIKAMLLPHQDCSKHCIIPRNPDLKLTKDNAITVTTAQRRYIVSSWKTTRLASTYCSSLEHILNAPAAS
jgi:hypothetical protein